MFQWPKSDLCTGAKSLLSSCVRFQICRGKALQSCRCNIRPIHIRQPNEYSTSLLRHYKSRQKQIQHFHLAKTSADQCQPGLPGLQNKTSPIAFLNEPKIVFFFLCSNGVKFAQFHGKNFEILGNPDANRHQQG